MRALAVLFAAVSAVRLATADTPPPPPHKPYHLLLGPYEYDEHRHHLPRYYRLDDKHYTSVEALKAAIVALPPGSTVYLRGSCQPETAIELPPHPISLSELRSYCSEHHVTFTWTFGPGGY
jgi:hypothetical protein